MKTKHADRYDRNPKQAMARGLVIEGARRKAGIHPAKQPTHKHERGFFDNHNAWMCWNVARSGVFRDLPGLADVADESNDAPDIPAAFREACE